jgi:hypothetical protein
MNFPRSAAGMLAVALFAVLPLAATAQTFAPARKRSGLSARVSFLLDEMRL